MRVLIAVLALAGSLCAQPFVDASSKAQLVKALPELSALEFDTNQDQLESVQRALGMELQNLLERFVNLSIAEQVHEMRFNGAQRGWAEQRDQFEYDVTASPFAESRKNAPPPAGFLIVGNFLAMVGDFLSDNYNASRFRYLGRIAEGGRPSLLIAFQAVDRSREGLVWVDETAHRILRIRANTQMKMGSGALPDHLGEEHVRVGSRPVQVPARADLLLPPRETERRLVRRQVPIDTMAGEEAGGQPPAPDHEADRVD
jgi:hypothetical protein